MFLDDWQCWCLDNMLAEDANGQWLAQQVCLILPRQNGKNAILEALELYAFYVLDEERIIHTAQLSKTAADHMQRMVGLVKANHELDEITHVYVANGKEALERLDTGARLEFMTRGKRTVRGGSPRRLIFDEALFLTDPQIQAIIPALSAQSMNVDGSPQMIYTSSAPLASEESDVLRRIRERGQSGTAKRMFYAEWGCTAADDPLDRDNWYAANPGLGVRISEEWVEENELSTMSLDAFRVERLGVVLEDATGRAVKIPADKWVETGIPQQDAVARFPELRAIGFDVSPGLQMATVAVASGSLQAPYVEVIRHDAGTGWLPAFITDLAARHNVPVGCNGAGDAGAVVGPVLAALTAAGIPADRLHQLSQVQYKQACGGFLVDVIEGRLLRPATGQLALDAAVADATERVLGDAWAWDRRQATVPISPLVAVTIARALLPAEPPFRVFAY